MFELVDQYRMIIEHVGEEDTIYYLLFMEVKIH